VSSSGAKKQPLNIIFTTISGLLRFSITMKKNLLSLLFLFLFFSCNNRNGVPNVSRITVNVPVERFDKDLFAIDTNNITAGLQNLAQRHPGFYPDYMQEVLGVSGNPSDSSTLSVTRQFLTGYYAIADSLEKKYSDAGWLQKELEQSFRYVKYYFPAYRTGKAILFIGPFDAPGVATTNQGLAIGLQQFAGRNFSVYQTEQAQELFPLYISRRFSPEYITANCMKAVVNDLFPDKSAGKGLLEQMVEKGKQWWLLDKFLPNTPDSIKTGFTRMQLEWCKVNEGLIWTYLLKNEDLNSINPTVIQTYIGEGPFTQGFSQEDSPGNLGQWIGWQIVKKFVSKNASLKPEDVMNTPARKIIDEAKYKPK
jgi:hypothetical protein